ncbi:unnamed protein product [Rotaria sp. Silwood2]|nr:unnamed protein product [Rotaria sp. Silwood2]CAF4290351.1 unnamed protein product [Rotaria sp. Silwood2]
MSTAQSCSSSVQVEDDTQNILLDVHNNNNSLAHDVMTCKKIYSLLKSSKYGNILVDNVLYDAHSVASHVSKLADEYRIKIRQELIEPLENQTVTICPDLWSDRYRQVSYLGITICFTNDKYEFLTYDLCCAPFVENDKTAPNIIIAIQKALEPFGITDLTKLNFVSDRGPNFLKALKPFATTNCVAHRLNNIPKGGFYQTSKKKTNCNKVVPSQTLNTVSSSDSENDHNTDEDEDNKNDEQGADGKTREHHRQGEGYAANYMDYENNDDIRGGLRVVSSNILDYSIVKLLDVPLAAFKILKTIESCKSLVRYLKKVRNKQWIQVVA